MLNLDIQRFLITMVAVLPSLTVHEFAHAWTAYKFGDNTAKDMGRLTLNPIAHIDLFVFIKTSVCNPYEHTHASL